MAMIKCPECGQEVSDKAPACIHCGFPLEEYVAELNDGSPRYDLYVSNTENTPEENWKIQERIFKELLGMSQADIQNLKGKLLEKVAQNLTIEQVSKVMGPFIAYGMWKNVSAHEHDSTNCFLNGDIDGYLPEYEVQQDHYDGPVINEAQKVEIKPAATTHYTSHSSSSTSSAARPTSTGIKCPNCGSTNVQRITMPGRVASTAVWGIASKKMAKTYKCKSCGHTW